MTKRSRSIIFLIFLIIFLLAAPIAILFSLGYRLDPQKTKLVQTGGLFLKAIPNATDIFVTPFDTGGSKVIKGLTGQTKIFYKRTGIFQGSVFVKNLFPQKYTVKIEKPGFYGWEKTLEVSEGLVTEAKDIILIPKNPSFVLLLENVQDFWFSPDQNYAILETSSRDLILFDIKKNTSSLLIKAEEMKIKKSDYLDLAFSSDPKKALVKIKRGKENFFFVLLVQEKPPQLISLNLSVSNVKKVSFNPENPDEIFFTRQFPEGNFVFSANFIEKTTSAEPILADSLTYEITSKEIIWLNNKGFLLRRGFFNREAEYLNPEKPFNIDGEKEYQLVADDFNILLKEGDVFYFFDEDIKDFIRIFEGAEVLSFSPDHKKTALTDKKELWIVFLKEQKHQPYKNKLEKTALTNFSGNINQCSWFSTQYLISTDEKNIKISEIDDRDKINIIELSSPVSPSGETGLDKIEKIFFGQNNKKLYILSGTNFYSSEPLR